MIEMQTADNRKTFIATDKTMQLVSFSLILCFLLLNEDGELGQDDGRRRTIIMSLIKIPRERSLGKRWEIRGIFLAKHFKRRVRDAPCKFSLMQLVWLQIGG